MHKGKSVLTYYCVRYTIKMILRMTMKNKRVDSLIKLSLLALNDDIQWNMAIVCWAYILQQQLPRYSCTENDLQLKNMRRHDF